MANEHFISGRKAGEHHAGRRTAVRHLAGAVESLRQWRAEATAAHESGHGVDREVMPQDQEIVLFLAPGKFIEETKSDGTIVKHTTSFSVPSGSIFEMPEVKQMMQDNREPLDDGKFDSQGNR